MNCKTKNFFLITNKVCHPGAGPRSNTPEFRIAYVCARVPYIVHRPIGPAVFQKFISCYSRRAYSCGENKRRDKQRTRLWLFSDARVGGRVEAEKIARRSVRSFHCSMYTSAVRTIPLSCIACLRCSPNIEYTHRMSRISKYKCKCKFQI